jgi:hypothetical protein
VGGGEGGRRVITVEVVVSQAKPNASCARPRVYQLKTTPPQFPPPHFFSHAPPLSTPPLPCPRPRPRPPLPPYSSRVGGRLKESSPLGSVSKPGRAS